MRLLKSGSEALCVHNPTYSLARLHVTPCSLFHKSEWAHDVNVSGESNRLKSSVVNLAGFFVCF